MHVTPAIHDVRRSVAAARANGRRIGCVPTMGALHAGHLSLIEEARRHCEFVVVTLFVNPTQFGPEEDLARYPRPLADDLARCTEAGVDLVFTPEVEELYPPQFETSVDLPRISATLEGVQRPGHFRGVATIVLKLFNIVQPDVACFGQKDYQQQALIRRMVQDLDLPIEIITCPTVREPDGLAMSSRNVYLSPDDRVAALSLSRCLTHAAEAIAGGEADLTAVQTRMRTLLEAVPNVEVEYAVIASADSLEILSRPQAEMVALVAARVGTTRLIDNRVLSFP